MHVCTSVDRARVVIVVCLSAMIWICPATVCFGAILSGYRTTHTHTSATTSSQAAPGSDKPSDPQKKLPKEDVKEKGLSSPDLSLPSYDITDPSPQNAPKEVAQQILEGREVSKRESMPPLPFFEFNQPERASAPVKDAKLLQEGLEKKAKPLTDDEETLLKR